jgi:hypothetical protein
LNIAVWLLALACVSLIIHLLVQRTSASEAKSERLALLVGARRAWGESDASLRRRCIALSRWPYTQQAPVLVWWARLWKRVWQGKGP